jgi:hypothetical protein
VTEFISGAINWQNRHNSSNNEAKWGTGEY